LISNQFHKKRNQICTWFGGRAYVGVGGLHLVTGRRPGRLGGAARGGLRAGGASLPQRPREPARQRTRLLLPPTSRLLPRASRVLALCGARAREAGARTRPLGTAPLARRPGPAAPPLSRSPRSAPPPVRVGKRIVIAKLNPWNEKREG